MEERVASTTMARYSQQDYWFCPAPHLVWVWMSINPPFG